MASLRLGKPFGIPLTVHWSFWLAPAFVYFSALSHAGPEEARMMLALVLSLFGCVALHEYGHALAARAFGIPTKDITLYPIGGVARLTRMSESPGQELAIAAAGPAVNVGIAGLIAAGMVLAGLPLTLSLGVDPFLPNLLERLFWSNVGLAAFNMLPAFPMDGGRVLRALLGLRLSAVRATRYAVAVGMATALLFGYLAYEVGNPVLVVIGLVTVALGQQELLMVKLRNRRARARRAAPEAVGVVVVEPEQVLDAGGPARGFPGWGDFRADEAGNLVFAPRGRS